MEAEKNYKTETEKINVFDTCKILPAFVMKS